MNASISFCLAAAQCHLSGISELEMTNLDTQRIYFVRHAESEINAFNMPRRKKGEPFLECFAKWGKYRQTDLFYNRRHGFSVDLHWHIIASLEQIGVKYFLPLSFEMKNS